MLLKLLLLKSLWILLQRHFAVLQCRPCFSHLSLSRMRYLSLVCTSVLSSLQAAASTRFLLDAEMEHC